MASKVYPSEGGAFSRNADGSLNRLDAPVAPAPAPVAKPVATETPAASEDNAGQAAPKAVAPKQQPKASA